MDEQRRGKVAMDRDDLRRRRKASIIMEIGDDDDDDHHHRMMAITIQEETDEVMDDRWRHTVEAFGHFQLARHGAC
jgi:hypothetical protein